MPQHFIPIQSEPKKEPKQFKHELQPMSAYRNTGTLKVMRQTQPIVKTIPKFDPKNPQQNLPPLKPDEDPYATVSFVDTMKTQIEKLIKKGSKDSKETQSISAIKTNSESVDSDDTHFHYYVVIDASFSMLGQYEKSAKKSAHFIAKMLFKKHLTSHLGLYFFSDNVVHQLNIHNMKEFQTVYEQKWNEIPKAGTNLTLLLDTVWKQHLHRNKPVTTSTPDSTDFKQPERQSNTKHYTRVLIITDGAPNDQESVKQSIINTTNSLEDQETYRVSFLQVGNSVGATGFLEELDDNLVKDGAKLDIIDHVSWYLMGGDSLYQHIKRCFRLFRTKKTKKSKEQHPEPKPQTHS